MRLRQLNAKLLVWTPDGYPEVERVEHASGLFFDCPLQGHQHSILVWFAAHFGGAPVAPDRERPRERYVVMGSTVDNLSLSPLIDMGAVSRRCTECGSDAPCRQHPDARVAEFPPTCRWRGYVGDGEAE